MTPKIVLDHLHDHSEDFAAMSDVKLCIKDGEEDVVLPCHSPVLALNSKVLRTMFANHPKDEWEAGLATAFAGFSYLDVRTYLSANYCLHDETVFAPVLHNRDGVASIALKLDAKDVLKSLDKYVSIEYKPVKNGEYTQIFPKLELACRAEMPKLQQQCITELLRNCWKNYNKIRAWKVFKHVASEVNIDSKTAFLMIQGLSKALDYVYFNISSKSKYRPTGFFEAVEYEQLPSKQ